MIYLQKADKLYISNDKRFVGRNIKTIGAYETVQEAAKRIRKLKRLLPDTVFYTSSKPCKNWVVK